MPSHEHGDHPRCATSSLIRASLSSGNRSASTSQMPRLRATAIRKPVLWSPVSKIVRRRMRPERRDGAPGLRDARVSSNGNRAEGAGRSRATKISDCRLQRDGQGRRHRHRRGLS